MPQRFTPLEKALKDALQGDVRFDAQSKALYATDASNYRHVPIGVVLPKTEEDIRRTVALCREAGVPILSRGAGTSLAGQCCNAAVILDMSKHRNHILSIDAAARTARVEPGVILDHLRSAAEAYGLTFGPDPATHSRCTLGGMIGNNSCGVHAMAWGKTVDNVESLTVLTYDGLTLPVGKISEDELVSIIRAGGRRGEIYGQLKSIRDRYAPLIRARYPKIPRRVSGYNLDELLPENGFHVARSLVGSEGTCVTILDAALRLVPNPKARSLLVVGFPSIYKAAEAVPTILPHRPIGLEGFDMDMVQGLLRYQGFAEKVAALPAGQGWLLIEFGGNSQAESDAKAQALRPHLQGAVLGPMAAGSAVAMAIWTVRESVLAATAFVPGLPDRHEGWDDASVPPERLAAYLPELRGLYDKYGYRGAFYGHFGDGCVHTRIDFDFETEQGRQNTRRFLDEAADLVVRYGGSLSGEHGDGQARAELLPKMFGPELVEAFREFKAAWDPAGRMNPGKIVQPRGILDDLRHLPPASETKNPFSETHFHFPLQENSFTRALLRCVGVGKCRNESGGAMCPSYQATRNEKDSTRGRAHLLFEMVKGDVIKDGWKSEEVKDALDLCLSCKGCKSDCPTNVDMATYKAEFLSHYYEGRLRPRQAYAFGLVEHWAKLGSHAPGLVNFLTQTSPLSFLFRWAAGMDGRRAIPRLAPETFQRWCARLGSGPKMHTSATSGLTPAVHTSANSGLTPAVHKGALLWPDTFTNYFQPEIGQAAVRVLEHLGYSVTVPRTSVCCGRPLYDFGFLDQAKCQLQNILTDLKPQIEAGVPMIVLEPSCAAVFRDELVNLFPDNPLAKTLCQNTFLLSEFLVRDLPASLTGLAGKKAILQTHCHHKAVFGDAAEREVLNRLGYEVATPESGCCGMAGSFGFDADHAALSRQIGERALLPAIRQASAETLLVADGFSCREQIRQETGRPAYHLAQVLAKALSL